MPACIYNLRTWEGEAKEFKASFDYNNMFKASHSYKISLFQKINSNLPDFEVHYDQDRVALTVMKFAGEIDTANQSTQKRPLSDALSGVFDKGTQVPSKKYGFLTNGALSSE